MGFLSFLGRMLFSRTTVILVGLIAVGVLIWFVGPNISLWGLTPLASRAARIGTIVGLILLLVGLELMRYWRVRRLNRKMIENLTSSQTLASMTDGTSEDELEILRQRFEDAMAALKESSGRGSNLYDLPWYLIIGPPGSGKTTILRNSGLQFPLAERLGVDVIEGVGGTRSCDWWLTDQAVLLDTAGRYTTQDVNAASDATTWRGFLNILKENRPRQPVNGVIIAIDLASILVQDEQARKRTIEAVKARLQEIMRGFGIRMPVYVLFTKADLVAGFTEFFEDLDDSEREQVWGITLPLDSSSTSATALTAVRGQAEGLLQRLSSQVPQRLNEERSGDRRRSIYAFPAQLAGIRPLLENFVEEVFRPSRYSMQPLFRGMYFTSGTQQGAPIDRMNAAYARAFGFGSAPTPPHSGPAKPFFIHRLLTDVIIAERGVVGRNRRLERRILLTRLGTAAACLLALAGIGAYWYSGEADARREVMVFERDFAEIQKGLAEYKASPSLTTALPPLDTMRQQVQTVHRNAFEESGRWIDLDADSYLATPFENAYDRMLRKVALPQVKDRLENALKQASERRDTETLNELLALYLGLGEPERFNQKGLEQWLTLDLEQALPLRPDLRNTMDQHAQALFKDWPGPQPLDEDVISTARRALTGMPPVDQLYSALEAAGNRYAAKDLSDVVGLDGLQILVRRSPAATAPQIPYLYTADGFYNIFLKQLPTLGQDQTKGDDWVVGAEAKAASQEELQALLQAATDRYTKTYISTWRKFLNDIDIRDLRDIGDANTVLAMLSGAQSPVTQLLSFAADNVNLPFQTGLGSVDTSVLKNIPGGSKLASAATKANTIADKASNAATQSSGLSNRWPGTPITKAFSDIISLVNGTNGQRPGIADVQQDLISAYGQVNAIDTASDIGKASYEAVRQRLQAKNRQDALSQLTNRAVAQPEPLRRILAALPPNLWRVMLSETRGYLNDKWRSDVVGECTRAILNRYPVYKDGRDETTVKDFGSFFGPGGTLETYQSTYLTDFIDTNARPWKNRLVEGDGLNLSAPFLSSLEDAAVVRSTFFRAGTPTPGVDFTLKPTFLDAQSARIAIDTGSQLITYRHEPPRIFKLTWPDAAGNQQVVVTITDTNGTSNSVQTSGPWAWFRLFDQMRLQKTGLADKFQLPITIRDRKATFELSADSITNPFELPELNQYRCQSGL